MRIWGYILIVLNIGAAGAFLYFATMVWGNRLKWQYALLQQEMIIRGFPLEASKQVPDDLDEGSVPFYFYYADHQVVAISKERLKKYLPQGGDVLGTKDPNPITNQQDEAIRVEKKVFEDLDAIKDDAEKRFRLMLLLLNLSTGSGRQGVFALLRDWPKPEIPGAKKEDLQTILARLETDDIIRRDAAELGRTPRQVNALVALAAIANVNAAMAANVDPQELAKIVRKAQKEIARWIRSEIPNATPDAWVKVNPAPPFTNEPSPKNENRDRLSDALRPLLDQLEKKIEESKDAKADPPDPAAVKAAVDRVKGLLDGDNAITTAEAKAVIPFIVAIGGNLLANQEEVDAAKAKLVELIDLRVSTKAEKDAMAALVDLMIPLLKKDATVEQMGKDLNAAFAKRDTVAIELLRSYFEAAKAEPKVTKESPSEDYDTPRRELAGTLPRSPAEKRQLIAHLLYHLDSHLGGDATTRAEWYQTFAKAEAEKAEEFKLPAPDQALLDNRVKWHQRVAAIVGLEAYAASVEAQASQLRDYKDELRTRIIADQKVFLNRYQSIVTETGDLARQLRYREETVVKDLKVQKELDDNLKKQLVAQKELEDKLAAVTAEAKKSTTELEAKVDELFDITKKLGEAQDALLGLELRLRELELGKKKAKK